MIVVTEKGYSGRVFDRNSVPIAGVTVNLHVDVKVVAATTTDDSGEWELLLVQGEGVEVINGAKTIFIDCQTGWQTVNLPPLKKPWWKRLLA